MPKLRVQFSQGASPAKLFTRRNILTTGLELGSDSAAPKKQPLPCTPCMSQQKGRVCTKSPPQGHRARPGPRPGQAALPEPSAREGPGQRRPRRQPCSSGGRGRDGQGKEGKGKERRRPRGSPGAAPARPRRSPGHSGAGLPARCGRRCREPRRAERAPLGSPGLPPPPGALTAAAPAAERPPR